MKRALVAAATVVLSSFVLPSLPASAAPGGDVVTVVKSVSWGAEGTDTVMCPAGSRALGGGAAPVSPVVGSYLSRFRTDGPVDPVGGVIDNGEPAGGWQVVVSAAGTSSSLGSWKVFVTCSTSSDAVAIVQDFTSGSGQSFSLTCPSGRAVGGGLIGDASALLARSGPRDASLNQFGHSADGSIPTRWEVDVAEPAGGRAVVLCSATSDATLRGAALNTPGDDTTAATATATCPAGQRAVAGGLAADAGQLQAVNRLAFAAPVSSAVGIAGLSSGAVPQSWTLEGRGGGGTGYEVYAVCVTAPPLRDTTPPDTVKGKGPKKRTFATRATFSFSSEAGASFTCALDKKPVRPCSSPYKVRRLKPGKHKLSVTAKDAAGNADPTPAVFKWKVLKKQKPHH